MFLRPNKLGFGTNKLNSEFDLKLNSFRYGLLKTLVQTLFNFNFKMDMMHLCPYKLFLFTYVLFAKCK